MSVQWLQQTRMFAAGRSFPPPVRASGPRCRGLTGGTARSPLRLPLFGRRGGHGIPAIRTHGTQEGVPDSVRGSRSVAGGIEHRRSGPPAGCRRPLPAGPGVWRHHAESPATPAEGAEDSLPHLHGGPATAPVRGIAGRRVPAGETRSGFRIAEPAITLKQGHPALPARPQRVWQRPRSMRGNSTGSKPEAVVRRRNSSNRRRSYRPDLPPADPRYRPELRPQTPVIDRTSYQQIPVIDRSSVRRRRCRPDLPPADAVIDRTSRPPMRLLTGPPVHGILVDASAHPGVCRRAVSLRCRAAMPV